VLSGTLSTAILYCIILFTSLNPLSKSERPAWYWPDVMWYNVTIEFSSDLEDVYCGQDGDGHHFGFYVAVSHASKAHVICVTGPSCFQVCDFHLLTAV